jgi:hypothetical protein
MQVISEPATASKLLRLDISSTGGVSITAITPTPLPSITPTVTQTVTPSPTATLTPTVIVVLPPAKTGAGDWVLANLMAWGTAFGLFWLGRRAGGTVRWAIRWSLLAAVGGLVAYFYLAIQFPGSQSWIESGDKAGVLLATLIGSVVGWLGGVAWKSWISRHARMEKQPRRPA